MTQQITKTEFYAQLEEAGEELVRERLARSHFGDRGDKRAMVVLWLEGKDQARRDTSNRESLRIAKSAKNAAWAAAIAAIIAAVCAVIAIVS
jgi:hypothetical protein